MDHIVEVGLDLVVQVRRGVRQQIALPMNRGAVEKPAVPWIDPDVVCLVGKPHEMLGRRERRQPQLFVAGSLRDVLPDDHVLVRIDRVLDLDWLPGEVAELYDARGGRPSIDPEVAVRLVLAGFLLGIVHDRRLLRKA